MTSLYYDMMKLAETNPNLLSIQLFSKYETICSKVFANLFSFTCFITKTKQIMLVLMFENKINQNEIILLAYNYKAQLCQIQKSKKF